MNDEKKLFELMPERVVKEARRLGITDEVEEIRLRVGLPVSFTANGKNYRADCSLSYEELDYIFCMLTCGSFYAHEHTISRGYIVYGGSRIGLAGDFTPEGALRSLSSLCIRLPRRIYNVCMPLVECICGENGGGMLIFSPPGSGKTTLLRDIAVKLSSPPIMKRVVICDERGEIFDAETMKGCLLDTLAGMTKSDAIACATRSLSPEFIICDEIGGYDEANAMLSSQNCGVPLVCSAHAPSLSALLRRPNIALLHEARVFAHYCQLERGADNHFRFEITEREKC